METLIVILNLLKTLNLSVNPIENTQSKLKSSKNTKFKPKSYRKHLTQA